MFAGVTFADMNLLLEAGYDSRKAARRAFADKVRLLYAFDGEESRLCVLQALLLMTYWDEGPAALKDGWYWMGICVSLAGHLGLHRDPAHPSMDISQQGMRRRIWWSILSQDRLLALELRRPMHISDDDHNVAMLTLNDFESCSFPYEILDMVPKAEVFQRTDVKCALAILFIERSRLCHLMGRILKSQYLPVRQNSGILPGEIMILEPVSPLDASEILSHDRALQNWIEQLPSAARYSPAFTAALLGADELVHLYRGMLHMLYLSTSSALHRPPGLLSPSRSDLNKEVRILSRGRIEAAALGITAIAQELHNLNLTRYHSTFAVATLLPAFVIHLLGVKSGNPLVCRLSSQYFEQCMCILHCLCDIYPSADAASLLLKEAYQSGPWSHATSTDTQAQLQSLTPSPTPEGDDGESALGTLTSLQRYLCKKRKVSTSNVIDLAAFTPQATRDIYMPTFPQPETEDRLAEKHVGLFIPSCRMEDVNPIDYSSSAYFHLDGDSFADRGRFEAISTLDHWDDKIFDRNLSA